MFTKEELNKTFNNNVINYTKSSDDITFTIDGNQFELQSTGLLTLLEDVLNDKREYHMRITSLNELKAAIYNINDWIDDWND